MNKIIIKKFNQYFYDEFLNSLEVASDSQFYPI